MIRLLGVLMGLAIVGSSVVAEARPVRVWTPRTYVGVGPGVHIRAPGVVIDIGPRYYRPLPPPPRRRWRW